MKITIILCLVAAAYAAPQGQTEIPIIRLDSNINPDGSYQYAYETGNGITADESGALKNIGAEEPAIQVQGQFSYPSDQGAIQLTYIANENGFQPQGSHLPTPPPIPADIQRSLDFLATAPPQPQRR